MLLYGGQTIATWLVFPRFIEIGFEFGNVMMEGGTLDLHTLLEPLWGNVLIQDARNRPFYYPSLARRRYSTVGVSTVGILRILEQRLRTFLAISGHPMSLHGRRFLIDTFITATLKPRGTVSESTELRFKVGKRVWTSFNLTICGRLFSDTSWRSHSFGTLFSASFIEFFQLRLIHIGGKSTLFLSILSGTSL